MGKATIVPTQEMIDIARTGLMTNVTAFKVEVDVNSQGFINFIENTALVIAHLEANVRMLQKAIHKTD